jgi:hypothetical protein
VGILLGFLTLIAVVFGGALVLWGFAFSPVYALWLFAILLLPAILIGQGFGALTRSRARRQPGFEPALSAYLAGHQTPFNAAKLATGLTGSLFDGRGMKWRSIIVVYLAAIAVLTLVWIAGQPGDAARWYYGLDGTVTFPLEPTPQVLHAAGLWLLAAAAFFPAFVIGLVLTRRALPDLAVGSDRDRIYAAAELVAGTAIAVVASEGILVAVENWFTGREAYELGAIEALGQFWRTGFLMRAYLGYPSTGIFFYAAFAVPLWMATVAAATSLLRGLAERGVTVRGFARFQGKPVEAVSAIGFRLVLLINIGFVFLRAVGTDLNDPSTQNAAPTGVAPNQAALVRQFDQLAFGSGKDTIEKLITDISISVEGEPRLSNRHQTTLTTVLTDLSALTNLSFSRVPSGGMIRITLVPLRVLNRIHFNTSHGLAAGPITRLVCSVSADGQILLGRENAPELNDNCIPHEFMHAIGFGGHACLYRPSALCNLDLVSRFSDGDRTLIRALYDSQLVNGMERAEAMRSVNEILDDPAR